MAKTDNILVLKSEITNADLLKSEFDKLDFTPTISMAGTVNEFEEAVQTESPSLVICCDCPSSLNWYDALKIVRDQSDIIPFIVVSESGSDDEIADAILNGAADYVSVDNLQRLCPAVKRELDNYQKAQKLADTRQKYEGLVNSVPGIVWEADAQTLKFNFVSPKSREILGYEPEEWYQDTNFWKDHIHSDDREQAIKYCHYKSKIGENHSFEYRMQHVSGEYIWIKDHVTVISENGKPSKLRGIMTDITDKKKVEQQRDKAYEMAEIGDWEYNVLTGNIYWSDTLKDIHEVPRDYDPDVDSATGYFVEGYEDKMTNAITRAVEDNKPFDLELQIKTAKGNTKWVRAVGEGEFKQNRCIRIIGTFQDITKRRKALEASLKSEMRFKSLVQAAHELIAVIDLEGMYKFVAHTSYRRKTLGIAADKLFGTCCFDSVHDDDLSELKRLLRDLKQDEQIQTNPYRFKSADGEWRWLESTITNLTHNPAIRGYVVNSKDITETIEHRERLKEALERYRYVTKATDDVIYDWDIINNELKWDDSFRSKFIYRISTGRYTIDTWLKNVHPDDVKDVNEHLKHTLYDTNSAKWEHEYRFKRKDGNYAAVFERGFIIRNKKGEPKRMIGSLADITERKQSENELRKSLREKETLLLEIHHRVKNNLAVVSGMMQLQAFNEENEQVKEKLFDSVTRIQAMGAIHELLYNSESFTELEFDKNVEKLVNDTIRTFRPALELHTRFDLDDINLNVNQAIPCSLIINEILSNILKYAYNDREEGNISIEMNNEDGRVIVIIQDDGACLPDDFVNEKDIDSLGMELINTLTNQLEGAYSFENVVQGTRFELSFCKGSPKGSANAKLT